MFLFTELVVGGKTVTTNEHFFQPYKNLSLPRPQVSADAAPTRTGFKITLSSDKVARAVYLSAPNYTGFFADNYFDLIPGRKVEVEFRTSVAIGLSEFRNQLKIRTMADAF